MMDLIKNSNFRGTLRIVAFAAFLILLLILAWNNPPGCLFLDIKNKNDFGGVKFGGFAFYDVLFLAVNYLIVCFLGYCLIQAIFRNLKEHVLIKFFASFFVGYISLIGIARVVSLIFPYHFFYWPSLIVAGLLMGILILKYPKVKDQNKFSWNVIPTLIAILIFFAACLWVVLFLQMRLNIGSFMWAGHGPDQYAYLHDHLMGMYLDHFPIFRQHYDELMFHEFLYSGMLRQFDPIIPWWITLGLIKVSAVFFLFLIFRMLDADRLLSLIFALFICIGSFSLVLTKYYIFFDAGNPIWLTAHSGRIVGILFMVLIINDLLKDSGSQNALPKIFYGLAGLGLSATSVSNFFWLIIMAGWTLILLVMAEKNNLESRIGKPATFLTFMIVSVCLLLYGISFGEDVEILGINVYTIRTAAICLLIGLWLYRLFPLMKAVFQGKFCIFSQKERINKIFIFLVSAILGFLFLGNLLVGNKLSQFGLNFYKNLGSQVQVLTLSDKKGTVFQMKEGSGRIGDFRQIGEFNPYCHNLIRFASVYGGILLAILLVNILYVQRFNLLKINIAENIFYELFLLAALALPCLLFLMDFIDCGGKAWLKSRLLELPIYFIVFTLMYLLSKVKGAKRYLVAIILVLFMMIPFLATERPTQIQENWKVFIDLVRR